MSIYPIPWRALLICLCILGLTPTTSVARDKEDEEQYQQSRSETLPDDKKASLKQRIQQQTEKRERSSEKESLKEQIRYQTQPRQEDQRRPEHRRQPDRDESLKERTRYQTRPRQAEQRELEHRERSDQDQSLKKRIQQQTQQRQLEQHQFERRERSNRDYSTRSAPRRLPRTSHDRYYETYVSQLKRSHHYYQHENYRYHTFFLAPIKRHYPPLNYRVTILPRTYIRIIVGGWPYFYYDGIFYRQYIGGYVVVRAPLGAVVRILPLGFIAFSIAGFTYYYVNDTYYIWDDDQEAYVVVDKPDGAEEAIAEVTEGRIYAYPKQGQTEAQQAKDRYECHRWAVSETRVDPTITDDDSISLKDKRDYRRAISACLEGRGYTVK